MKRSEINAAIRFAEELCKKHGIHLPDFAFYPADKSCFLSEDRKNIVDVMLGWDVTDYNEDRFDELGAVLFTVRNGNVYDDTIGTPYAEKYIFMKDGCEQEIPLHYHIKKTEDIINRAGGVLCVQLYAEAEGGGLDYNAPITVYRDGVKYVAKAGEVVEITNGNSITLTPHTFHRFYTKLGTGDLIIGEVSKINDDNIDNVFAVERDRFCNVEEDEAPYRLLVNEYR